jgi:hypothetical protein
MSFQSAMTRDAKVQTASRGDATHLNETDYTAVLRLAAETVQRQLIAPPQGLAGLLMAVARTFLPAEWALALEHKRQAKLRVALMMKLSAYPDYLLKDMGIAAIDPINCTIETFSGESIPVRLDGQSLNTRITAGIGQSPPTMGRRN